MQVVKNFGFTRPFIKTMQGGDYIRFADEFTGSAARPRPSMDAARSRLPDGLPNRLPLDRIQHMNGRPGARPGARPSARHSAQAPASNMSLRAFRDWCQTMKASWDDMDDVEANLPTRHWRSFEEAREFARSLGLHSGADWRRFSKGELELVGRRPEDIPGCPERIYRDEGWSGYRDWLGII